MLPKKIEAFHINKIGLLTIISLLVLILTLTSSISNTYSAPTTEVEPRWSYSLPSKVCSAGGTDCQISSPVLADLNGDNFPEVIIATNSGHIIALNQSDGTELWNTDISASFGAPANTNSIESSPAVADIDKDGDMEIVVGVGSTVRSDCTQGGVIVLDHEGNVQNGWPQKAFDTNNDGCTETVFSTPALGDLNGDGYLEIVVGGFDKRIYAWRYNGTLLPGFPAASFLSNRFSWTGLESKLADTIWSSPALADMNGDGYLEIIIGSDEGNFDSRWEGDAQGWTCPYATPSGSAEGYCGGSLYVLDRFGNLLPGFPKYILETIQSSPALADINHDGFMEIFIGTGTYYYNNSPDRPTYGFRLHGWDNMGNDLPGWSGGKVVNNLASASPSIGDIAGDSGLEVVVGTKAGTIYAWHTNGQLVDGFPMTPKDRFGNTHPFGRSFLLGDYDGDGKMEIIFNQASMVAVVDGNGHQLTVSNTNLNAIAYRTRSALRNDPAIGDVDNDGKLELVAQSDTLFLWDLDSSTAAADWPMFKHDAARTSSLGQPILKVTPENYFAFHLASDSNDINFDLLVKNLGIGCIEWQATATQQTHVSYLPISGSVCEGEETAVSVTILTKELAMGQNDLGEIHVTGTVNQTPIASSPQITSLTVNKANEIYTSYLPATQK